MTLALYKWLIIAANSLQSVLTSKVLVLALSRCYECGNVTRIFVDMLLGWTSLCFFRATAAPGPTNQAARKVKSEKLDSTQISQETSSRLRGAPKTSSALLPYLPSVTDT